MSLVYRACLVFIIPGLFVACSGREVAKPQPDPNPTESARLLVNKTPKGDLLFVIDDSGSMLEEQEALRTNFGTIISVLENLPSGLPDLHLGVVSTNVGMNLSGNCAGDGDNGKLLVSSCATPPNGTFISDSPIVGGGRDTNYTGTLSDAFSCIAELGTGGCGYEQPLESMKRALDPPNQEVADNNQGFLRTDAILGVIILSDEDDCSVPNPADRSVITAESSNAYLANVQCAKQAYDCDNVTPTMDWTGPGTNQLCDNREDGALGNPDDYVNFLRELKSADNGHTETRIVVAGIFGPPQENIGVKEEGGQLFVEESCTYTLGGTTSEAAPANRIDGFVKSFARNTTNTICTDDLAPAVQQIAALLGDVFEDPCVSDVVTTDKCIAEFQADDPALSEIFPVCPSMMPSDADTPCWYLDAAGGCPAGQTSFVVELGTSFNTPGTAVLSCSTD